MSNAPLILTLDCDMYSNDPSTVERVLCYFWEKTTGSIGPNYGYIQFPQRYHGLNRADIYASQYKRLFLVNAMGLDGLRGPNHVGTGCFFHRRVFFGGPSSYLQPEIPELSPSYIVEKPINGKDVIRQAHLVAGCNYENQTNWGCKVTESWFFIYAFLFIGAYGEDFIDFMCIGRGGTFERWWNDQRMWLIRGHSSFPIGIIEFISKHLGLETHGFNVTSKLMDDEQIERYQKGMFEFGVESPMFVCLATAAILNLIAFLGGVGKWDIFFIQIFISGFGVFNSFPFLFLRRVPMGGCQ